MSQPVRSERIEARIAPDILATVRRAAEMQGRSLSEFVVAAAEQAARRTIEDLQIVRLSADDQLRFVESLLNEATQPAPAMKRAAERHQHLFKEP
ncbi:MAG: DUF1778 domain-containing protein [Geminicoccaceae bacterium]